MVEWTQQLVDAFVQAQASIHDAQILFHVRSDRPLYLETDASSLGYGAVLFQTAAGMRPPFPPDSKDIFPLAYYSQKWSTAAQRAYDPCTRELRALWGAVQKFRDILLVNPFTILSDNMGVVGLLGRSRLPKNPSPRINYQRWLNDIAMYPWTDVVHLSTNLMWTSDGLSRLIWMELAADDDDPGVWPLAPTPGGAACAFSSPGPSDRDISRCIVRHCRHERCPSSSTDGCHPWSDVQAIVRRDLGSNVAIDRLWTALGNNERVHLSVEGVEATVGHSVGTPPAYRVYPGNKPMYHMTRPRLLATIRRDGLRSMNRQFIHLTTDVTRTTKDRSQTISMTPAALRAAGLTIYSTKRPRVFLCPGPIPPELLNFEQAQSRAS